jgi:mannose-6-phosphate isomerase-like protein (cupin superfamily)
MLMTRIHRRLLLAALSLSALSLSACWQPRPARPAGEPATYQANILEQARTNTLYQRVLFTGARLQLAVMSLHPGEDIGKHQHDTVEHVLFCASGSGKVVLDGVESSFEPGRMVAITAGTTHDVINTGAGPLQIYAVYAPPGNLPGRAWATKASAEADVVNETFDRNVR